MTDSAYLKKKENKMRVLEKLELIDDVATKLADLHDVKKVNAFLDELGFPNVEKNTDISLKEHILARLDGVSADAIIRIAKDELEMDISKFKSITAADEF